MQLQNRKPAVAGMFYEGDSASLKAHLKKLFSQAKKPVSNDGVAAVIVPHAGYVYSGGVAASGFNQIPSDAEFNRVFLIGSSHKVAFEGASVFCSGNYVTPLGEVEVDLDVAHELIKSSSKITSDPAAHFEEHSLEVELPFLQYHLKHPFKLVPIVMGPYGTDAAQDVAEVLAKWFCPGNLFVISSDFSHYPSYQDAKEVDSITAQAVLKNSPRELLSTLAKNNRKHVHGLATSLCGWTSVLSLLYITEKQCDVYLRKIEYKNSGDTEFGDKDRVVGYNAIVVFRQEDTREKGNSFVLNKNEKEWLLKRSHQALYSAVKEEYPEDPKELFSEKLKAHAGAFVSLYREGKLRGCIGTFGENVPLWKMVDRMTAAAALHDSRFKPVASEEIDDIHIEISVLTPMKKIEDVSEIIPGKHGIFIEKDGHTGTFLPQVADKTGWDREELLGHCARDKAGLGWNGWKDANIYIYEALIFGD